MSFSLTVSDCRKQTGPPDAANNLQKSHFIMCHMTKYSTILGVFQQPLQFTIVKALGTQLTKCLQDKAIPGLENAYNPK